MKLLNLDAHATPKRALQIGGKEYPVRETSVQQFIDSMRQAEELEQKGSLTPKESIESTLAMIKESVPTLPHDVLYGFSLEQMLLVLQFIRGELDSKVTGPAAEGAEAEASDDTKS